MFIRSVGNNERQTAKKTNSNWNLLQYFSHYDYFHFQIFFSFYMLFSCTKTNGKIIGARKWFTNFFFSKLNARVCAYCSRNFLFAIAMNQTIYPLTQKNINTFKHTWYFYQRKNVCFFDWIFWTKKNMNYLIWFLFNGWWIWIVSHKLLLSVLGILHIISFRPLQSNRCNDVCTYRLFSRIIVLYHKWWSK